MDSLDTLIRTVAGEAGKSPAEQAAVAAAILNRARVKGKTIDQIVREPGQFESWSNPTARSRMMSLDQSSPAYQAIRSVVEPVYSGQVSDPTNGATNFYAPKAQASLGRKAPKWDDGSGADIGQSRFFNRGAPTAGQDYDADASLGSSSPQTNYDADASLGPPSKAAAATPAKAPAPIAAPVVASDGFTTPKGDKVDPQTRARLNAEATQMMSNGATRQDFDAWTQRNGLPTYGPDLDAALQSQSGGVINNINKELGKADTWLRGTVPGYGGVSDFAGSFDRGLRDVTDTLTLGGDKLQNWGDDKIPGLAGFRQWATDNVPGISAAQRLTGNVPGRNDIPAELAREQAGRDAYDAQYGGRFGTGLGRLTGNIVGTAPIMYLGGEVAAPVMEATGLGGAATFLGGNAGRAVAADAATGTPAVAGNLLTRGASLAANGGVQGAGYSGLTSSTSPNVPVVDQMISGAKAGAIVNPILGGAGSVISKAFPGASQATADLAKTAINKYGINVRGGQITKNPIIRRMDAQAEGVPFSGTAENNATQLSQFTRAVGRTFGADSDNLTPKVMSDAKAKISNVYNTVAGRTNLNLNPETGSPFINNISQILADSQGVLDTTKIPALNNLVDNVLSKVGPDGTMPGASFKALTSKGSMLDKAASDSNPSFANAAKSIKAELNDALAKSAAPEDVAALKQADWQWKNMRTVEKLVAKSPDNQFSPALLNNAVTTSFKDRAYSGAGDLGELADIGQTFLKPPTSSGTAENARAQNLLNTIGLVGGGLAGFGAHLAGAPMSSSIPIGAAVGPPTLQALKLGSNAIVARTLGSQAYRNSLINSALDNSPSLARHLKPFPFIAGNTLVQRTTASPNTSVSGQ